MDLEAKLDALFGGDDGPNANSAVSAIPEHEAPEIAPGAKLNEITNAQESVNDHMKQFSNPTDWLPYGYSDAFMNYVKGMKDAEQDVDLTRQTGVNNINAKDTLKYSRLVDRLNNKRFIGPANLGNIGYKASTGSAIDNRATRFGDVYKMDGIETAESRAQKRNEQYEKDVTGRRIGRQQNVKDMGPELARLQELDRLSHTRELRQEEIRERKELYDKYIYQTIDAPFQLQMSQKLATFMQDLQLKYGLQRASYIQQKLSSGNPNDVMSAMMMGNSLGVQSMDMQQVVFYSELQRRGWHANMPNAIEEYYKIWNEIIGYMGGQGAAGAQAAWQAADRTSK